MSRRVAGIVTVALAAITLAGCAPTYDPEFEEFAGHRHPGTAVAPREVRLAGGTAVGVLVTNAGEWIDGDVSVDVAPRDAAIASADPWEDNSRIFILTGLATGSTELDVSIDGTVYSTIPITVFPQP